MDAEKLPRGGKDSLIAKCPHRTGKDIIVDHIGKIDSGNPSSFDIPKGAKNKGTIEQKEKNKNHCRKKTQEDK